MMRSRSGSKPERRGGPRALALFAAVTVLSLLTGATAAYAIWSAIASVNSTASTATVTVGHALSGSTLAVTYNSTTTAAVGVVTVTNTGTRDGTYSVAISATSASPTLRAAVVVEVGTAASCTTSATLTSPVTGTFAATVTKTGSLASGASIALCVRTSMTAGNITANANTSLAATVASSITVGTWSASASPAITFTQTVAAATQIIDSGAWYRLRSVINTGQCAEGLGAATSSGTAVTIGACTAPNGTDASELFRFQPTSGGYYRVVYRAAPTLGLAANGNGNNRDIFLNTDTSDLAQWLPVFNADNTVTLTYLNNSGRCLSIPGGSTTVGTQLQIQNCVANSTSQRFTLTMFNTATPAPIVLSCSADGYNAYYSWPQLTGYETDVVYRVYINSILVNPHTRGTGWDPTVQFGNASITTAIYGSGSQPVLVQQNVNNAGWTTTGTGTLILANSAPYLLCG